MKPHQVLSVHANKAAHMRYHRSLGWPDNAQQKSPARSLEIVICEICDAHVRPEAALHRGKLLKNQGATHRVDGSAITALHRKNRRQKQKKPRSWLHPGFALEQVVRA
ncbi:MAG: hypothetical protein HC858_10310 [Brachymonas sp.]|nr:hypothetical protein [Brachymonas sp.]